MRPRKCRKIAFSPEATVFKPAGIPMREMDVVELALEEAEAIRLADWEGLYHEDAGKQMEVSRQTFSRLLVSAHKKVADALINGKGLVIQSDE